MRVKKVGWFCWLLCGNGMTGGRATSSNKRCLCVWAFELDMEVVVCLVEPVLDGGFCALLFGRRTVGNAIS